MSNVAWRIVGFISALKHGAFSSNLDKTWLEPGS